MKVKFFYISWDYEEEINNFIKDKKIIEIKMNNDLVMVIYEE